MAAAAVADPASGGGATRPSVARSVAERVVRWDPKCPKCGREYDDPPREWICVACSSRVWQPDTDVDTCMVCRTKKLSKGSRHHCRQCGNCACDDCSKFTTTIPGWGSAKYRVCSLCAVPESTAAFEGYLYKVATKGVFGGEKLQKRYFELRGSTLVYGQTKEGARYGCLNITGCRVMDDGAHTHAMCIVGQQLARAYILAADSESDKMAWMTAISEMLKREQQQSAVRRLELDDDDDEHGTGALGDAAASPGVNSASMGGVLHSNAQGTSATETALLASAMARSQYERQRSNQVGLRDFELIKVIGVGTFSQVALSRKRGTSTLVALKAYDKAQVASAHTSHTLNAERAVHGALADTGNDPALNFISTMKFAFQTKTHLFLATEWCPGGELYFHLQICKRFPELRARLYVGEVAVALDALHRRGFVYRDVKPENVVVRADGHAALLDLAWTKQIGPAAGAADPTRVMLNEQHRSQTFCGTPEYMAPEVVERNGHSCASDWWSLGILLYELVAGVPPFFSRNVSELYEMIRSQPVAYPDYFSKDLQNLLSRLLDPEPHTRLQRVQDLFAHKFFHGLSQRKVVSLETPADFVPTLNNDVDARYFSPAFTQLSVNTFLDQPIDDAEAGMYPDYAYPAAGDGAASASPSLGGSRATL